MQRSAMILFFACLASGGAYAQNCSDIRPNICALKLPFEPDPGASGTTAGSSPVCDIDPANLPDQKNTIQAAFDLASGNMKRDLCSISNIYLIESGSQHSWGRWEDPTIHGSVPGKTQIAVNQNDLSKTFSNVQDANLSGLGLNAHANHIEPSVPQRVDPQTFGLFYVLAHELGHIRWHRDAGIGSPVGCDDDPNFFSWLDIAPARTNRWTSFNASSTVAHKHKAPKPADVHDPNGLKSIYTGGFVTALAAVSPEEDFVESYAIRALMGACPTCEFDIKIGSGGNMTSIKVNSDGGNPILRAKFNCVYNKYIK